MQHTLNSVITFEGIGVHSGASVSMTLYPAEIDKGVVFARSDISEGDKYIPAKVQNVIDTRLCTVIANKDGVRVSTVEHLMAALRGCGIDNVLVELDGEEVPIMDGSSIDFVSKIWDTGLHPQDAARKVIKVLKDVSYEETDQDGHVKRVTLSPDDESVFAGMIDFNHPMIMQQDCDVSISQGGFRTHLADARTFGYASDLEKLQAMGLARGSSLDNAIGLTKDGILNEGGLRRPDEFIRHKLLDAVGDMFLAGAPIIGRFDAVRPGHDMNSKILRKLLADPYAFTFIECKDDIDSINELVRPNPRVQYYPYSTAYPS